jgi:hypothetical protein
MSNSYCCPDGETCVGGGGDSGDAGACQVDCQKVCDAVAPGVQGGFASCWPQTDGTISYYCGACGVGRLPSDTKPCPIGETIGERLARQAYYEGVSVIAFERLADVLAANGAPEDLVARARRAAADEARHAAIFTDLAGAHGAAVPAIELASATPSLFELAIENATEGCVRETLGAAITLHQSMHAESEDVRAAFASICDDEAEHAALSWDLQAWFDARLSEGERARIVSAHRAALEEARAAAREAADAAGFALGLPSPERTRRMLDLAVEAMAA